MSWRLNFHQAQIQRFNYKSTSNIIILQQRQMNAQANTPGEELRAKYTRDKSLFQNHQFDEYFEKLKKIGISVHKSLYFANFRLKNGLAFHGMAARQTIAKNQVLVTVPQRFLLSSMLALKEKALEQVYSDPFFNYFNSWEDRVLLVYCLYIKSLEGKSCTLFYDMIERMSKDIDIGFTWTDKQIDLIKDKTIRNAVDYNKKAFEAEWDEFKEVQKNHVILQAPQFNKSNYLWIFIHISSRCFGKSLDYTSFVPFCEFFNHHASTVYYCTDNPKIGTIALKEGEQLELSEDGSNQSEQYFEEGQYAYDEIEMVTYKWGEKECLDLSKEHKVQIEEFAITLLNRVQTDIDWKDFSILFAGHFMTRVNLVKNEFIEGRKNFEKTYQMMQSLTEILEKYILLVKAFYKTKYGATFEYKVSNRENLEKQTLSYFVRPRPEDYHSEFKQFYLKTDRNDVFYPDTQVYFRYGRCSNRMLLLHYGFTIQGNKYDGVWLSYQLHDNLKQMPDLMERVMKLGLPIRRRFSVRYCQFNLKLIIFFRLNSWNLYSIGSLDEIFFVTNISNELMILDQIRSSLLEYLKIYENCQEEQLMDQSLNYHEYFCKVYNLEKKRILQRQIEMVEKLMTLLERVLQGQQLGKACDQLTAAEKYMLRDYLSTIVT